MQARALAKVRAARVKRDKAEEQVEAANEDLKREIKAALDVGAATSDVAVAAHLSRQRVFQISRGE